MATADIRTAQQVLIRYDLASLRDRGLAQLLDLVLLFFGLAIGFAVLGMTGLLDLGGLTWLVTLPLIAVGYLYSLLFELWWRGQTPGKRLLGLQVVKLGGADPTLPDYALRWAFRLIDLWGSLGALAALLIGTSERRQRLGDLVADTIVVRLRPDNVPTLDALLAMHEAEPGPLTYPQAARLFTEDDMLLALRVLERRERHDNAAHRALLRDVADRLAADLGLPDREGNSARFVRQVIRDYVALTR